MRTGRPYPNKHYAVGCRKHGRKALDGILIEAGQFVSELSCTARWVIEAELCVTHYVDYKVPDREFDSARDDMLLWHAWSGEMGGWSNRFPPGAERRGPIYTEPTTEVVPRDVPGQRANDDTFDHG